MALATGDEFNELLAPAERGQGGGAHRAGDNIPFASIACAHLRDIAQVHDVTVGAGREWAPDLPPRAGMRRCKRFSVESGVHEACQRRTLSIMRRVLILALTTLACVTTSAIAQADAGPRATQERLIELGWLPEGTASGRWDTRTSQGLMGFQGWAKLGRSGSLDRPTFIRLQSAERPRARTRAAGIEIDIPRQIALLVGRDGVVRRAFHVSTGKTGNTPRGTYRIFRRERMSWSVPFSSWMPYAMYFTGGFALHEYKDVPGYPASHGCVRMPAHEAPIAWRFAGMGTQVRIY